MAGGLTPKEAIFTAKDVFLDCILLIQEASFHFLINFFITLILVWSCKYIVHIVSGAQDFHMHNCYRRFIL